MFDYFTGFLLICLSFVVMIYLCPHTEVGFSPQTPPKSRRVWKDCVSDNHSPHEHQSGGKKHIASDSLLVSALDIIHHFTQTKPSIFFIFYWPIIIVYMCNTVPWTSGVPQGSDLWLPLCSNFVALLMAVKASLVISLHTVGNSVDCVQDWTNPAAAWLVETVIDQTMTLVQFYLLVEFLICAATDSYVTKLLTAKTLQPCSNMWSVLITSYCLSSVSFSSLESRKLLSHSWHCSPNKCFVDYLLTLLSAVMSVYSFNVF